MTIASGNPNDIVVPQLPSSGDDPSWVPDEWESEKFPLWRKVKDVYDGFHLPRIRRRYLVQAEGEGPDEYECRISTAYLDEHFRITLDKNAGLIAQFDVEPDSPEDMLDDELTKNVDNQGNSLKAFAQAALARIFRDECCLLGVSLAAGFTDEQQRSDRRPYYTIIDIRDVRAPLAQYIDDEGRITRSGGTLALTRVAIRRWVQIPMGEFGYDWMQEFWVYRLREGGCTLQIYQGGTQSEVEGGSVSRDRDEVIESTGSLPITEEILLADAAGRPIRQIPFFWFNIDKDAAVGLPGTPPLLYLAETLIVWFNKESQLDAAERRCNLPTPAQAHPGGVPENPPDITLGPGGVVHYAAGGDFKFVEPSGKALGSTHQRQVHREGRMERIDERFIGASTEGQALTAKATSIADKISKVTLEGIAQKLETAFAELFKLYALYTDPSYTPGSPAGGIQVSRGTLEGDLDAPTLTILLGMLQEQAIDRFEFRAMLKLQTTRLDDDVIEAAQKMREDFENNGGIAPFPDNPALSVSSAQVIAPPVPPAVA